MSAVFKALGIFWFGFGTVIFWGGMFNVDATDEVGLWARGILLIMWFVIAVVPAALVYGAGNRSGFKTTEEN